MRKTLLVAASTAALALGLAAPATAAPTDETTATFSVTAGSLDVVAPTSAIWAPVATGGVSAGGLLGAVTVTDGRGVTTAWVATASSTSFATPGGSTAIPNTAVTYNSGLVTANYGGNTPVGTTGALAITGGLSAVTSGTLTGNNAVSWDPTIAVAVPALASAGVYTGTITHSVA